MERAERLASTDANDGDAVMLKARLQVALHTLEQKAQALHTLEQMVLDQQKLVERERGGASATEVRCTDAMADVRRLEAELAEERAAVRRRQKGWRREREQRDAQLQQLLPQAAAGLALCEQERQDAQLAAAQADARAVEAQRMAHQRVAEVEAAGAAAAEQAAVAERAAAEQQRDLLDVRRMLADSEARAARLTLQAEQDSTAVAAAAVREEALQKRARELAARGQELGAALRNAREDGTGREARLAALLEAERGTCAELRAERLLAEQAPLERPALARLKAENEALHRQLAELTKSLTVLAR